MANPKPSTKLKQAMEHLDKALDTLLIVSDSDDIEFYTIDGIMEEIGNIKEDITALIAEL